MVRVNETDLVLQLREEMEVRFGVSPGEVQFVVAPYRICPLGAHIDHQLGTVTAMAIDQAVHLAFVPAQSREVRLFSTSFPGEACFNLDQIPERQNGDWGNYVRGAVRALQQKCQLRQGIYGIVSGRLGEGGLSSSAAFGVACLLALETVNDLQISVDENILLDQAIENSYLGLRIGILDQSAILLARRNKLTHIDCATRQHKSITSARSMPSWTILLAFSGMTKSLASTDYNRRVDECAEAAKMLLAANGRPDQKPVLRNVEPFEYTKYKHRLIGPVARRAAHYFTEMSRVKQGLEAWQRGDLSEFGRLMTASGESSIYNYECGAPPLITLYELLIASPGVYGARFSGAGFRGCCVAIVDSERAEAVAACVKAAYVARHPDLAERAATLLCHSDDGARVIRIPI